MEQATEFRGECGACDDLKKYGATPHSTHSCIASAEGIMQKGLKSQDLTCPCEHGARDVCALHKGKFCVKCGHKESDPEEQNCSECGGQVVSQNQANRIAEHEARLQANAGRSF